MKRFIVLVVVTFLLAGLTGCGGRIPGAPTGPGTDLPCGAIRVSCFPFDGTHTCCREHHICSQNNGCLDERNTFEQYGAARVERTPEGP